MNRFAPPRHIVWSTDALDLSDPFQRTCYLRRVLLHGRAEEIHTLGLDEVARLLDDLHLPPAVHSLWQRFLEARHAAR